MLKTCLRLEMRTLLYVLLRVFISGTMIAFGQVGVYRLQKFHISALTSVMFQKFVTYYSLMGFGVSGLLKMWEILVCSYHSLNGD